MDNSDFGMTYLQQRGEAPAAARDLAAQIKVEYTRKRQEEADTALKALIGQGGFAGQLAYVVRTGQQVSRLTRNAAHGLLTAVEEGAETAYDVVKGVSGGGKGGAEGEKPEPRPQMAPNLGEQFPEYAAGMRALKRGIGAGDSNLDIMTQKAVQFAAPFSLYLKGLGGMSMAAKGPAVAKAAVADALTMATAFDPHEERFADLLVDLGMDNAYLRYMTDPNESEAEGRFKNVLDSQVVNLAVGVGLAPIVWGGAKAFKRVRGATTAAKAVKP